MVWGANTATHKSALVEIDGNLNSRRYIDKILDPVALPFGNAAIGPGFISQDDHACPHATDIVREFHDQHQDYTHGMACILPRP